MLKNIVRFFALSLSCMLFFEACSENNTKTSHQYLEEVLSDLAEIKSATYDSHSESWAPGDTVPSIVQHEYYKAYDNPSDTTIGASWVVLDGEDTSQIKSVYDGNVHAYFNHEVKEIFLDSFKVRKLPFRPITVPFYKYTRNILEYALTTDDSITIDQNESGDTLYVKLTIHEDKQVEFFGKAFYIPEPPHGYMDPTSRYELWIDKSTGLPFKYRREMEHNISLETVSNPKFNTQNLNDFVAASYFPAGYEIWQKGENRKTKSPHKLLGKKAPDWLLTNEYAEKVGLSEFESKVVLVQFTSVNCGPCRASIPFLNKLSTKYDKEDFDLVAIESYTSNTNVLSNYRKRTGLDFKFLMSEKEVNSNYNIQGTPVFFILDENRIVRSVHYGYGGAPTEKKITESINQLI